MAFILWTSISDTNVKNISSRHTKVNAFPIASSIQIGNTINGIRDNVLTKFGITLYTIYRICGERNFIYCNVTIGNANNTIANYGNTSLEVINMLVTVVNNKGGQGKTLLATLVTRYLLSNPDNSGNILCCDLDKTQQNFKDNLAGIDVPVITSLADIDEKLLCIVDTPPSLDKDVMQAVRSADILIAPVVLGKHSVQGVMRIAEIRGKKDLRLVSNEWDSSIVQKQAEIFLAEQGFKIVGKIPKYKRLAYNIDAGLDWYTGFSEEQIKKIIGMLDRLLKVK